MIFLPEEPVEMTVKEEIIHARSGACEAYILYGAIERLYELETLFVFYDMMRFWAVPKRLLGRVEEANAWRVDFERRIKEMGEDAGSPFRRRPISARTADLHPAGIPGRLRK